MNREESVNRIGLVQEISGCVRIVRAIYRIAAYLAVAIGVLLILEVVR